VAKGGARAAFIASGGCMVDGVQRCGAPVQGLGIGQRCGGKACLTRARVFGGVPYAGTTKREREDHCSEGVRWNATSRLTLQGHLGWRSPDVLGLVLAAGGCYARDFV
jgi:hypothetical protein